MGTSGLKKGEDEYYDLSKLDEIAKNLKSNFRTFKQNIPAKLGARPLKPDLRSKLKSMDRIASQLKAEIERLDKSSRVPAKLEAKLKKPE